MKKLFLLFVFPFTTLLADPTAPFVMPENQKIAFQNSIIAKVNGKTFSMLDVKRKLDLYFHRNYPHLMNSMPARYQFYQQSWRQIVMEMIDHELILADAADKEVKLTDGEVREEMENRFGPNTLLTLDKIGLSYEEAWKMVKDEMIVQRMSWWFIQNKAMQTVTPDDIRQAYRNYLKENPSYQEWTYRLITIRGQDATQIGEKAYTFLSQSGKSPDELTKDLEALGNTQNSIQISNSITVSDKDVSDIYKVQLSPLSQGQYSAPLIKNSPSEKQNICKIFYCEAISQHVAPKFEEIHTKLRDALLQQAIQNQSLVYLEKLRSQYGFDAASLKAAIPEDLQPFSIE